MKKCFCKKVSSDRYFYTAAREELEKLRLLGGDFEENLKNHPFSKSESRAKRDIYQIMTKGV